MSTENYKNVVIGSGEGGKYLAWHLAQSGQQTAVIERRWIGGSCPNVNCLPSKNEIWSAKVANLVYHAGKFGSLAHPAPVDMVAVRNRKREMVRAMVAAHLNRYKATGAELVMGEAKFTAPHTIEVRLKKVVCARCSPSASFSIWAPRRRYLPCPVSRRARRSRISRFSNSTESPNTSS